MIPVLLLAIIAVESSNNPCAVGDQGRSLGLLQIQHGVIEDINRIYSTQFVHTDAFHPDTAKVIFELYTLYWARRYAEQTGKPITMEVLARTWNGGPFWYHKPHTTDSYWAKVKQHINEIH